MVPTSGDPEVFFRFFMRKFIFLKTRFRDGHEIRTRDQRPMVLPPTPFAKALVRWATGKRLTDRPGEPHSPPPHPEDKKKVPASFLHALECVMDVSKASNLKYKVFLHIYIYNDPGPG